MPLYLGIDAGGTKTDCAISNGAELLGQASGETCKLACVGPEMASARLQETILQACKSASILPRDIHRVCLGITGASLETTVNWARETIQELVPGGIQVVGDHIVAHRAAFGLSAGVLVVAGTGSIAYGRNQKGESARAGGWGPVASDEGSGHWIGRLAVATALRARDQGRTDGLPLAITQRWKLKPEELVRVANSGPKFAELAETVSAAAEKSDAAAQEIMKRAGNELAALAGVVIARLWPQGGVVRVALAGGVFQGSALVRDQFRQALRQTYPEAGVSFTTVRPVLGALEIAAERAMPQ
jgi:N-acetylglucosamine kinase-like BadF-type ATPase